MKTIGLIGGMSYESTLKYYRIINEETLKRLKGLHSAKMLIESYDFDEIERMQSLEDWESLTKILINSAKKLETAGADYIAIATNTMHLMADKVQENINIPLIHIAEAAANVIKAENIGNCKAKGANAVVLGCTELPNIIKQTDTGVKIINTTEAHCLEIVNRITEG